MNQFSERYKSYSNSELLKIIKNSVDYQPEAVKAAEDEIEERSLSEKDLKEAENELKAQQEEKNRQIEERQENEKKIKEFGYKIADTFNPVQKSVPSGDKHIKIITILFSIISVYQFFNEFGMLGFIFSGDSGEWDFSIVLYFVPLLLVPVATFLFWLRKKTGWILLVTYLTYSAVGSIGLLIQSLNMEPTGIPAFDDILPQTPLLAYILAFSFFAVLLWIVSKENIRVKFSISKNAMALTIGIVVILTILFLSFFL